MAIHASGRSSRRSRTRTPSQQATAVTETPKDTPMAPQPPKQPVVLIETDEALRRLWGPHDDALTEANSAALTAEPFERDAASKRADARKRREDADRLNAEAAELEAAAAQDDRAAQHHRQNQTHFHQVAHDIATAVDFLRMTNNKLHPAELAQRAEQQAAANAAAQSPLTAPLGDLVSASPDPAVTASFAPVPAESK